jgi:hypothetical protein
MPQSDDEAMPLICNGIRSWLPLQVNGAVVELGASVAISDFRLLIKMLAGDPTLKMGKAHTPGYEDNIRNSGIGIYDGDGAWSLLTSNTPSFLSKLKMLLHYNINLWTMSHTTKTAEI